MQTEPAPPRTPSALWLWGFWVYFGAASAAIILSRHIATPGDRFLRGVGGILLVLGGPHALRVAAYKSAARGPYTLWGFNSYLTQRQTARSAMILGAALIASALIGL